MQVNQNLKTTNTNKNKVLNKQTSTFLELLKQNKDEKTKLENKLQTQQYFAQKALYESTLSMQNMGLLSQNSKDENQEDMFAFLSPLYSLKEYQDFYHKKNKLMDVLTSQMNAKVLQIELNALNTVKINKLDGLVFDKALKEEFEAKFGKDLKYDKESLKKYEEFFESKLQEIKKLVEKQA